MKRSDRWARIVSSAVRTASALALAVVIGGLCVTPVLAQGWDHGHGRHHGYDKHYRHGRYVRPGYVVAPAPVVYGPPPPVVVAPPPAPPPGISIVFPIHIR